ncbi:MAG: GNAT family N-acetyltransferase [Nitrososphaerales archaeon]
MRPALEEDIPVLIANFRAVSDEKIYLFTEVVTDERAKRLAQSIKNENNLNAVAEVDSRIVGEISLYSFGDSSKSEHVRNLGMMIINGFREIGVGSALMDYAIKWAFEQPKVEKITLGVFSTNLLAKKLYEKFGFGVDGVYKEMFKINGEYVDEFLMSRFV